MLVLADSLERLPGLHMVVAGDVAALAEAMARLGAEARNLVAERFTWDRIAAAAEQELLALVRAGRGRPSAPPPH